MALGLTLIVRLVGPYLPSKIGGSKGCTQPAFGHSAMRDCCATRDTVVRFTIEKHAESWLFNGAIAA